MTKYDPRMVPASFDFWRANLNFDSSSAGTSMPSDSVKPTARFDSRVDAVHDVDRESRVVEHVRHVEAVDLEVADLERT